MSIHPFDCNCTAYACQLRSKAVQLSPAATPTRRNFVASNNARFNSWEKGIATEKRKGGTEMPILNKDGQVIPIKKFIEQRHKYDELRRKRAANNF